MRATRYVCARPAAIRVEIRLSLRCTTRSPTLLAPWWEDRAPLFRPFLGDAGYAVRRIRRSERSPLVYGPMVSSSHPQIVVSPQDAKGLDAEPHGGQPLRLPRRWARARGITTGTQLATMSRGRQSRPRVQAATRTLTQHALRFMNTGSMRTGVLGQSTRRCPLHASTATRRSPRLQPVAPPSRKPCAGSNSCWNAKGQETHSSSRWLTGWSPIAGCATHFPPCHHTTAAGALTPVGRRQLLTRSPTRRPSL